MPARQDLMINIWNHWLESLTVLRGLGSTAIMLPVKEPKWTHGSTCSATHTRRAMASVKRLGAGKRLSLPLVGPPPLHLPHLSSSFPLPTYPAPLHIFLHLVTTLMNLRPVWCARPYPLVPAVWSRPWKEDIWLSHKISTWLLISVPSW